MEEKHDYVLMEDVIIQKGTILSYSPNQRGGVHGRECIVGIGNDFSGVFWVSKAGIKDSNGIIIETK